MTDSEKPTPDELPSAGRPMAGKPGAGEGPTVRFSQASRPADESPRADPPAAEPPTTPIAVPGPPSGNRDDDSDEPTVINSPSSAEAEERTRAAAVDDEPNVEQTKPARLPGDDLAGGGATRVERAVPGELGVERGLPGELGAERGLSGELGRERGLPGELGAERSQPGERREDAAGGPSGLLDPVIPGAGGGPGDVRDSASVRKNDLVRAPDPDGLTVLPETEAGEEGENTVRASWRKLSSASALIWVLLALFGFTLVVQLNSNDTDQGLATARQEDLVRILSDLEARDTRLSAEISTLEQSQRQLTSGVAGRQAALAEADKRADELGLLAGTLPGRGPGLRILIDPKSGTVKASAILNAVQELRGAGGEVMELVGADGTAVRIVASTYFVDAGGGGIIADGARLTGPYTLWVIGSPQTMQTALQIPGGVVASVESAGGSVTMDQRSLVEVTVVRKATSLQYARPVS